MYNDLLTIGPLTVHGYGLMIAIGVIAAYFVAEKRAAKVGLDPDALFGLTVCAVVTGLGGAKLLYYILDIREILENPRVLLDISNGFVVYGGIITGVLCVLLYCRVRKLPFLRYADIMLPSVALGQGFGRIGCFLAGCCYGEETSCPLHIVFTHSDYAPNGVALIPTQLYSSALNFLNFIVLSVIAAKAKKPGTATICYLLFYSIGRFTIEFFRGDLIRGSVGPLSTSQFISIFVAAAAVVLLVMLRRKGNKID